MLMGLCQTSQYLSPEFTASATPRVTPLPKGCKSPYTRSDFHRAARRYRSFPFTRRDRRTVRKVIRCAATPKARARMRFHRARYARGYHRRFYWQIRRARLTQTQVDMLDRLGGCETRGIEARYGRGANYRYDGAHDGRYQYKPSTWQRAQAWVGVPVRRRTGEAHVASPAQQDVVTARFFPSHRGEWACSA